MTAPAARPAGQCDEGPMIHHSPLPDVEVPDLARTEYVLAGGAGQPEKPALIDAVSGRVLTYGELERAIGSLAGGRAAAGFGPGTCWPCWPRTCRSTPWRSTGSRWPAGPSRRSTRRIPRPRCIISLP